MNAQLLQWLISTGLDEQRSEVYLALLSLGSASAKEIATSTNLNRTAVYDNLRYLEEKGYIITIHEGKRKVFVPLHPKELYKQFDQKRQQLKDLLPDFLAVYASDALRPSVQQFQGRHAAREVYEDILAVTKKEYHYFSPQRMTYQAVEKAYIKKWIERRVKKGIESYSLRVQEKEIDHESIFTAETEYLRQIRYLPAYVDLKATIYIYENNIGIISTQAENNATIIHSPDVAYSFRQIFQFLWSVSMKS